MPQHHTATRSHPHDLPKGPVSGLTSAAQWGVILYCVVMYLARDEARLREDRARKKASGRSRMREREDQRPGHERRGSGKEREDRGSGRGDREMSRRKELYEEKDVVNNDGKDVQKTMRRHGRSSEPQIVSDDQLHHHGRTSRTDTRPKHRHNNGIKDDANNLSATKQSEAWSKIRACRGADRDEERRYVSPMAHTSGALVRMQNSSDNRMGQREVHWGSVRVYGERTSSRSQESDER